MFGFLLNIRTQTMSSYTHTSKEDDKSFAAIIRDALFIFAFFPAMKCFVTIMEFTNVFGLKLGRTTMLDYAIQLISLTYIFYYVFSMKRR